ncbi:MAG: bifunctional oligoribonuclease/PAP phosphatase NrnA [Acidimicrobiia bacterium]|nr:bifunctional oligoribonuclease/PAP phosphatase NrnA [Acidimicrobiia bacterium]
MTSKRSDIEAALDAAAELLADAESVGALGHVGPDGDAIGASWGIALAASKAGKTAVASFGEPFAIPKHFGFLNQDVVVSAKEFPEGLDVVIACDSASVERLGSLAKAALSAKKVVVIDHHGTNEGFGDVDIIDPDASSTAELVYRLLLRLGWPIDIDVATCLWTGVVSDTGRFQYSNTRPETLRVAAELLEFDVASDVVGQELFERAPFGYFGVVAAVLGRAQLDPELQLVSATLFQTDLDAAECRYEDTDGLIDLVRLADESDVALLIKALDPGSVMSSLRSRGAIDVAAIARALGGGGHHNASGFSFKGTPEEALAAVKGELAKQRS